MEAFVSNAWRLAETPYSFYNSNKAIKDGNRLLARS